MPVDIGEIRIKHPLHLAVWQNDEKTLKELLCGPEGKLLLETKDPRNRTPLMLAVVLGFKGCAKLLMDANANVNIEDEHGFNVLHEAVSAGDPELIEQVLERRDYQRYSHRMDGIPILLKKIRDTPDFYVEMKWEFTSWVPLVSRMCPSDTYKIYKSGSSVRIDTTLLGFDQSNWQRGSRSFVFKGQENGAIFMEIDHDLQQVQIENMKMVSPHLAETLNFLKPLPEVIQMRLTSPTVVTYIDTDKIHFERSKAGIIGFRSEKTEVVNGHECKVFTANNVEVVTRTRTEHLSEEDKAKHKAATASRLTPLQSLLGMIEIEENAHPDSNPSAAEANECNPQNITAEQYFDKNFPLAKADIGKPREISSKIQRFKANLWLSENYPLSLPEQVLPIVDLMAISSSHFAKLRDFINLQLPSGFPVKIEIPLFHVLNARITFGNIFSFDEPVNGVIAIKDEATAACVVEDGCFEVPPGYKVLGDNAMRTWSLDDEDELVQMAIQQYLMEEGTEADQVTLWEALKQQPDSDLQRAIQESLEDYRKQISFSDENSQPAICKTPNAGIDCQQDTPNGHIASNNGVPWSGNSDWTEDMKVAIQLSQKMQEEDDKKRKEEEAILEQVLKLSITEK